MLLALTPTVPRRGTLSVGRATCLCFEFLRVFCAVVLFVFLNFLLRVRAFRLDVSVLKKKEKKREKDHPAMGQGGSIKQQHKQVDP